MKRGSQECLMESIIYICILWQYYGGLTEENTMRKPNLGEVGETHGWNNG